MVPGWNEALLLMNPGTKAQLLIPSRLAYGERGYPGLIPPNTPIIFDIEVLPF
jgi:FKBP-type peptidyl-prolyl cis-trans isomerase